MDVEPPPGDLPSLRYDRRVAQIVKDGQTLGYLQAFPIRTWRRRLAGGASNSRSKTD